MHLSVTLLGRLRFTVAHEVVLDGLAGRSAELLCYLLLHPDRPHPREGLASLLWGEHCTTAQSKKYLRQTLWQLQAALQRVPESEGLLCTDGDWIWLSPRGYLTLDVALFERAYACLRDVRGRALNDDEVEALNWAVSLYQGDLLDGWYQEWCMCERERLRQLYLLMLDKLMEEHERLGCAEAGIAFGERSIAADPVRERTYQGLIRLHLALGDRTGALRLYERCVAALRNEFDVPPSAYTRTLLERIREGAPVAGGESTSQRSGPSGAEAEVTLMLDRLLQLHRHLQATQEEIAHEIESLRGAVGRLLR